MITVRIIFKYNKYLKNLIFKKFKIYKMMLMIDYDIVANYEAIKILFKYNKYYKKFLYFIYLYICYFIFFNFKYHDKFFF